MNWLTAKLKQNRRIVAQDITFFIRQFSTLYTAGVPLIRCFDVLEKSQAKNAMRLLVYSIKREMLSGRDLYGSLLPHRQYFDDMTCHLVKIGEQTGKLDEMLNRIANEKEKQAAMRKQIQQALFYPCLIGVTAVLVCLSLFCFVIPRFAELFANSQLQLPLITRVLFYLSAQFQQYGWICLVVLVLIFASLKNKIKQHFQRLPLFKGLLTKIRLMRFTRCLAMTCAAGLPLAEALKLLAGSQDKDVLAPAILQLSSQIHGGLHLHQAMARLSVFPDLMIQMTRIGEESGMLDNILVRLADMLENDIHQLIQQFSQLLEPLIMLVLGVLIGGLVIGMYLPLFKLGNVL